MSSVSVSGSGQRSLSLTMNDEARTGASMPTRQGDVVTFAVGGHNGELQLVIHPGSRLERIENPKDPEQVYYRLSIPGGVSGARYVRAEGLEDEATDPWPHASLDVRKNPEPGYTHNWPAEHVGTIADVVAAAAAPPAE